MEGVGGLREKDDLGRLRIHGIHVIEPLKMPLKSIKRVEGL